MLAWIASILLGLFAGCWVIFYQPGAYRGRHRTPEPTKKERR